MQLGRLAGLGEILQAVGQVRLAGRSEAGPGELLLAVGGGLLLGCDETRVANGTGTSAAPPPYSFIEAMCWFAGLYSFPQAVSAEVGCLTVAGRREAESS